MTRPTGLALVEFEWDDDKRREGIAIHGVDMVFAAAMFAGGTVTAEDGRTDYGETRHVAIGKVDDDLLVVVFSERGERIRLISARKAGRRDRRKFEAGLIGRDSEDEGRG